MELTLILGPMKSGKSLDMISLFAPLEYANIGFCLYQPQRNVRDEFIQSRNGIKLQAKKIKSLFDILNDTPREIIGIDEIHMFQEADARAVKEILNKGTRIIASGLDTDYQGRLFNIIIRLMELAPKEIKYKRAVCDICRAPTAVYTQILTADNQPVTGGLPPVVPDDGTYIYKAVCRQCFVSKS
jgi:thymidine kinase